MISRDSGKNIPVASSIWSLFSNKVWKESEMKSPLLYGYMYMQKKRDTNDFTLQYWDTTSKWLHSRAINLSEFLTIISGLFAYTELFVRPISVFVAFLNGFFLVLVIKTKFNVSTMSSTTNSSSEGPNSASNSQSCNREIVKRDV